MKLGRVLHSYTLPELETMRILCNLTKEEDEVFDLLARGDSIVAIASRLNISQGTVSNRIKGIKDKLERVNDLIE